RTNVTRLITSFCDSEPSSVVRSVGVMFDVGLSGLVVIGGSMPRHGVHRDGIAQWDSIPEYDSLEKPRHYIASDD
ncbi:hypothetical protein AbraIFM66950_011217, partial [Aspergillus brasiliensis]